MNTIKKRKELFEKYILCKESQINDNTVDSFYEVCNTDTESNHKYFFPFFKTTYKYYEKNISENLSVFEKWFSFLNYKELNHINSKQNYSDLDMFIIMCLKINLYLLNEEYIDQLMDYYFKFPSTTSWDSNIFVKYNLCKFYFSCGNFDKARNLYNEIIIYKREWYVLMLPFKYRDYEFINQVVINILHAKKINYYDYNIILKYLRENKIKDDSLFYLDDNPDFQQVNELKNLVISYIFDNEFDIKFGVLSAKTKSKAGFIKDNKNSYYISPKDMKRKYKVNQKYYFLLYDSYDFKKKSKSKNALIIKEMD